MLARIAVSLALIAACGPDRADAPDAPRLRLWHTFSSQETDALNEVLADRGVAPTLLPFSRAQHIVRETLESGEDCPDLVRIDATWLPGLARAGLLHEVPAALATPVWLAEAAELARDGDAIYGLPQAIDGLALLYNRELIARAGVAWPPQTVNELIATAHRLTIDDRWGLSARVDGYWFVAFLRAWGGDTVDPGRGALGIDAPVAATALTRFARLFGAGGVAPPPAAPGEEGPTLARRFRAGQVAIAVEGPWAVADLQRGLDLGVAPFPRDPDGRAAAPFGGHLFVVPACARDADGAWALAVELTAPRLQAAWARELGIVPTTAEGIAGAGEFAQAFREALRQARPLPRHPATAEMFDDLTPAVKAVVAGDATADEALAGVARAWARLLARYGIEVQP